MARLDVVLYIVNGYFDTQGAHHDATRQPHDDLVIIGDDYVAL